MERGEKARDGRDARDGPPDQMATDNKISPSGRRAEAAPRRSVQCAPSNLSRANIPAEAILTPAHTRKGGRHCWVGPLPSNRFYKTWEKVQMTSIYSFLQNEIGFIQSQLFSLII